MLHLPTASGEMFNRTDELSRKELDQVMYIFRITDPKPYNGYSEARVMKNIGVRHLKTLETAGAPVTTGSPS
jgi:hypothetical protein